METNSEKKLLTVAISSFTDPSKFQKSHICTYIYRASPVKLTCMCGQWEEEQQLQKCWCLEWTAAEMHRNSSSCSTASGGIKMFSMNPSKSLKGSYSAFCIIRFLDLRAAALHCLLVSNNMETYRLNEIWLPNHEGWNLSANVDEAPSVCCFTRCHNDGIEAQLFKSNQTTCVGNFQEFVGLVFCWLFSECLLVPFNFTEQ